MAVKKIRTCCGYALHGGHPGRHILVGSWHWYTGIGTGQGKELEGIEGIFG